MKRTTASCASMNRPSCARARLPALPTTAHVRQRYGEPPEAPPVPPLLSTAGWPGPERARATDSSACASAVASGPVDWGFGEERHVRSASIYINVSNPEANTREVKAKKQVTSVALHSQETERCVRACACAARSSLTYVRCVLSVVSAPQRLMSARHARSALWPGVRRSSAMAFTAGPLLRTISDSKWDRMGRGHGFAL